MPTMELATVYNTARDFNSWDLAVVSQLKVIGVGVIFIAGMIGVSLPLIGRGFRFLSTEGNVFFISRAFAAGVILATGFVHILPDGVGALQSACLPELWSSFPFGGFVAMLTALTTLLIDNLCTDYFEDLNSRLTQDETNENVPLIWSASRIQKPDRAFLREKSLLRLGSHAEITLLHDDDNMGQHVQEIVGPGEPHLPSKRDKAQVRNVVISQVLEVAVVSHSFIIGLLLGLSGSQHTIRALLVALSFHQFFEGFALGSSICQAVFECTSATVRASLFAVTTPVGIMVGIAVALTYNAATVEALIVEGLFDCASAGILIYIALVGLISSDFQCKRLRGNRQLQVLSYLALFGGTLSMSSLAFWA